MADTVSNQRAYPQQYGQKPGLGFSLFVVLLALPAFPAARYLLWLLAVLMCKRGDQHTLLSTMQDALKAGDIVLGDAFFRRTFSLQRCKQKAWIFC